ncbi:hypothetical protein HYPSUDRAFT_206907 [Hypholoma sublateritium FD-334 SS-4]|uniref:Uncharacterized protein n=1 Tax=Hypholoma sublateritium (strain FD-334 SS-4) TaxID=945553 RepID=A0A0D2KPR3_HYPSF|nr:hypothetical protein HYPSUDRAFT_206907 [Hypholoma sublateritium FD-334 SS-4]
MSSVSTIGLSIVKFFYFLWATFVGLLTFKEKAADPSQDIESGITVAAARRKLETEQVLDIGRDNILPLLPTNGLVGTICYDHPSRRPSRRASAVDPVKSRIVDLTLKQVQDRTTDVLKAVILLPPVIAIPCSARIEYYDPRADDSDIRFGTTKHRPKAKPRVTRFVLPPIIVEEVPSDSETESGSPRKRSSSLSDFFDLFPLPPTHIPQPPPAVLRRVGESRRSSLPVPVPVWSQPALNVVDDSGDYYYSEDDSVGSAYSSPSFSDATADTSLPGSPVSVKELVMFSEPRTEKELTSSPVHTPEGPTPTVAPNDTLVILQATINDDTLHVTHTAEEPGHDFFPSSGLVEHSHNVVDGCFKQVDLQKGDIVHETYLASKKLVQIQDMLVNSPSEDVIVDNLLAQLETSFELDKRESILRSKSRDLFYAGGFCTQNAPQSHIQSSVAPLRIVKKNPASVRNAPETELNEITASWEESLNQVLQAFKEVEIEDSDFHDLFYRDSSFFSRSSLAHGLRRSSEAIVPTTFSSCTSGRRSGDQSDESYESSEKSIEDILPTLDFLSDTIASVDAREDTLVNSLPSVASRLKDLIESTSYPAQDTQCDPRKAARGRNGDLYSWMPEDGENSIDHEEDYTETEGEDDQWSDHFELSGYAD